MSKKALRHLAVLTLIFSAGLTLTPANVSAQGWRQNGPRYEQNRSWNRNDRRQWLQQERYDNRNWRRQQWHQRDWRREAWRHNRWNNRYYRNYRPGNSFYFGFRY